MCEKIVDGFTDAVILISFSLGVMIVTPKIVHYMVKKNGFFRE
tara:strand:+ start:13548 stop:13676 length:129 start_codon:yes stop_codon:yes gene_type:complete